MQQQTKRELELVEQEILKLSEELDRMANSLEVIRRRLHNASVIEKTMEKDEVRPGAWTPDPVDVIHCAPYLRKDGTVVFDRGGKQIIVPSTVVEKPCRQRPSWNSSRPSASTWKISALRKAPCGSTATRK